MALDKAARIKNIKDKLEFIGCPFVENVEDTWLSELLFKPGEARLRLIEWLLSRFDPAVAELLECHQGRIGNLTDSRVGKLLFCSNLLGLCHNDDVDLITGSSKSRQLSFFEDLIDIVCLADLLDKPPRPIDVPATPSWSSQRKTIDDMFADDCTYLDLLCRQENLKDIFTEKIQLYPPDIEKKFGEKRSHVPNVAHLTSMASQIASELEKQNKTFERLRSNDSLSDESTTIDRVSRTMSLTMSTLSQMVEGFIQCYETEMNPWSSREKPRLSELGPAFKRVSLLLERFSKVLVSLEKLKINYIQILRLKSFESENDLVLLGTTALSNLHDCISILEETFKRQTDVLNDSESL